MNISGKPQLLKRINKNIVLNIVREKGPISRAKLSKITKISRPTMSNNIKSLERDNLIIEDGIGSLNKNGGKRPVLYIFNKDYGYVIGVQIRKNDIKSIITNYNAEIIEKKTVEIGEKRDFKTVIKKLFNSIDYILEKSEIKIEKLRGIGIGLNGIVDIKKGVLKFDSHFPKWEKDIEITKIVENRFKVKTYIDNNSRMLASAEKIFGIGKGFDNIVTIDTGGGIGSGVIIKGDIYRGNGFLAGEIGHTIINPEGPQCFCGKKGCAEVMISTMALINNIQKEIKNYKDSIIYKNYKSSFNKIELKDIFLAYISGDKLVEKVMSEIEYWFAILIGNTILNYDPEIIIIQGDYIKATDKFIKNIEKKLNNLILPPIESKPIIKISTIGKYAGPIGSASLVLSQLFNFSSVWSD